MNFVQYRPDIDGVKHLLIDPEKADMSGWTVEFIHGPRCVQSEFERQTWFGEAENWNAGFYGEPTDAWAAVAMAGEAPTAWISPDGCRREGWSPPFEI